MGKSKKKSIKSKQRKKRLRKGKILSPKKREDLIKTPERRAISTPKLVLTEVG